eukprot:m.92633 g.92633  ORF g.92633 m.92633 type:complete len:570 (+) comp15071_c0_seq6:2503-4212(+)
MAPTTMTALLAAFMLAGVPRSLAHPTTPLEASPDLCVGCTAILGLVDGLSVVHNATIDRSLDRLCGYLPKELAGPCKFLVDTFGTDVIALLENHFTPDEVCRELKFCSGPYAQCRLFPNPTASVVARRPSAHALRQAAKATSPLPKFCELPVFKEICDIIYGFANNHEPLDDLDKDGFSPIHTLRGADWRGKDCDDRSAAFHPGAKPIDGDREHDSNCNGIFGVDSSTGTPFEELLCNGTDSYGLIALGDSATAHFHIPPQYLDPTAMDNTTYKNVLYTLKNEFDWPQLSASTAFDSTSSWSPDIAGPVNSSYLTLRARNRCNHRDFQNIAVNGARAGSMNDTIQQSMSRDPKTDKPAIVVYALIGNDVCNGHVDTLAHMTTPQEMHDKALGTFQFLESKLPKGSHVFVMGLANGSILYDALHNHIHPIGRARQDVTYSDLYDYLNCLAISPCRGWMNSNATLRDVTTERAVELSAVLRNLTETLKPTNFDLHYFENPIGEALSRWEKRGGQAYELIEPVDGFHPNQYAQPLITEIVWEWIEKQFPAAMPPVNPNNQRIETLFGDQGGY